ncbi:MAG: hypothetical protein R3185_03065, partial [Candidatus Thermoplasmatota archaeon]|nr:hypothetical protein [Candidatus Thermoplasmatota archaeon]
MAARHPAPATASALLAALSLLLVPAAGLAQEFDPFPVRLGDPDVTGILETSGVFDDFVFIDLDGDGALDADEHLYLGRSGRDLEAGAIRLANPPVGVLGSSVEAGDPDEGGSIDRLSGDLGYFDADGDERFTHGDLLFLDRSDSRRNEVSAQDVILSGDEAGTIVTSHNLVGSPLEDYDGRIAYLDGDGNQRFGPGDRVYLDTNRDGFASVQDVTLGVTEFGRVVEPGDPGTVLALEPTGDVPDLVVFVDSDGDDDLDLDEPVYFATRTGRLPGGSVRVTSTDPHPPGSQVSGRDGDLGNPVDRLGGELAFWDGDGDDAFTPGDVLYYDLDQGDDGAISPLDLVLSGPQAGALVRGDDPRSGEGLEPWDGDLAYLDVDGDERFTQGDILYADTDRDALVTPMDVRLAGDLFGSVAGLAIPGTAHILVDRPGSTQPWTYADQGTPGYDALDPVYLATNGAGPLFPADVRIANPPGDLLIGTRLETRDADAGLRVDQLPGQLAYLDRDGDRAYGLGDTVYWDADGDAALSQGDIVLAGGTAGDHVTALRASGALLRGLNVDVLLLDVDQDGGYGPDDALYLDMDGNDFVTPGDLRFLRLDRLRTAPDGVTPTGGPDDQEDPPSTRGPSDEAPPSEDDDPGTG